MIIAVKISALTNFARKYSTIYAIDRPAPTSQRRFESHSIPRAPVHVLGLCGDFCTNVGRTIRSHFGASEGNIAPYRCTNASCQKKALLQVV